MKLIFLIPLVCALAAPVAAPAAQTAAAPPRRAASQTAVSLLAGAARTLRAKRVPEARALLTRIASPEKLPARLRLRFLLLSAQTERLVGKPEKEVLFLDDAIVLAAQTASTAVPRPKDPQNEGAEKRVSFAWSDWGVGRRYGEILTSLPGVAARVQNDLLARRNATLFAGANTLRDAYITQASGQATAGDVSRLFSTVAPLRVTARSPESDAEFSALDLTFTP